MAQVHILQILHRNNLKAGPPLYLIFPLRSTAPLLLFPSWLHLQHQDLLVPTALLRIYSSSIHCYNLKAWQPLLCSFLLCAITPFAGAQSLRVATFIRSAIPLATTALFSRVFLCFPPVPIVVPSSLLVSTQLGCLSHLSIHRFLQPSLRSLHFLPFCG